MTGNRLGVGPRGAAALEMTFVLPVLLTVALACVDLGRYAHASLALSNAVRIGAEWGAGRTVTSYSEADWKEQVVDLVQAEMAQLNGVDLSKLVVQVASIDEGNKLRRTEVQGNYPFTTIVTWPAFPHQINMERRNAMHQMR